MAAKKKAVKKKATPKKAKPKAVAKPKKKVTSKKKVAAKKAAKKAVKKATSKKKVATKKKAAKAKKSTAKKATRTKPLGEDLGFTDFTPYSMVKGEDYMNEEQIEHFRMLLNNWKAELMAKVDETVHHMQDEAANFPDPNDRATQESDFTMELRTRDRERKLIKKIEESLNRLDNDDYGYCESCGVEVGIRRLEARPTATECIDCKTLNEIKEKQFYK
ncbi:RNA polymerase-binding protein DksA [Kaarinaea lacus]